MKHMDSTVDVAFAASEYVKEKKYWLEKLADCPGKRGFPYDGKENGKSTLKKGEIGTGIVEFELTGDLFAKLKRTINNSDSRLFMILVTGMTALLHKYVGVEDVLLGAPIDRQPVEGEFINTVLIHRNKVTASMTFKELLLQVRQTITEACDNQNYPFESILYELGMEQDKGRPCPLLDLAILLENIQEKNYLRDVNFNLLFSFKREEERLKGTIEYNSRLYRAETVQRLAAHFTNLLESAFINIDSQLKDLDVRGDREKELQKEFNETGMPFPAETRIHNLFEEQVQTNPDAEAVLESGSGRRISYGGLNDMAEAVAAQLLKIGVGRGDLVAVMGERKIEILAGILGTLKAGAAYLPLDAQNPDDRLGFIIRDSSVSALLTQKHLIEKREAIGRLFSPETVLALDDEALYEGGTAKRENVLGEAADPAYVIYTSGTTGNPKGVLIEHRSLVNYIHWAAETYVKNEAVDFPMFGSISFDLSVTSIFTPLITGNRIVMYSGWNDGNLIDRIVDENEVGAVKLTPSHLQLIRDKDVSGVGNGETQKIKRFIVGGEELETGLAADIHRNFGGAVEIYNEYGPTEATVGCMIYRFDAERDNDVSVPIGVPAGNMRVYILDEQFAPVPIGGLGELYVAGAGLARGYLNRPLLTAERFIPDLFDGSGGKMYRTGDLAAWLADGNIRFLGRADQQVKIRGFRIEPGEIENRLLMHPDVAKALVTVKGEKTGSGEGTNSADKYLCAYIVSAEEIETASLRDFLGSALPDYMIPSFFVRLETMPLTPNGKVDMKALPEPSRTGDSEYTPPRDETDEKLIDIWSGILKVEKEKIGIDTNFFELGGHSLSATVLIANIHKAFNIKLPLIDIFRFATIRELSGALSEAEQEVFRAIEPAEEKPWYPLSSAQKRLYLMQQLEEGSTSYNIPLVVKMKGAVSAEQLEPIFNKLINRHESLRTSFKVVDDVVVQKIEETIDFKLEYRPAEVEDIDKTIRDFVKPFDLSLPPLLRALLVKQGDEEHLLMLDLHHVVTDGVSMDIIIKEFIALWEGKELPELTIQYKDYAQWQNSENEKEAVKQQENYWLERFKENVPALELPTDYERAEMQDFKGERLPFEIKAADYEALKNLAAEQGTTLYMVVLSLYVILLAKLSGQDNIVVGTINAGRRHATLQNVIGMFVNTLVLRNEVPDEKTFLEFLADVSRTTIEAFENQDYQFDELVEKVAVEREPGRNPLFDAMFQLENASPTEMEIPGLAIELYDYQDGTSKFDLSLIFAEGGETLRGIFEYSTGLFREETIQCFIGYFKEILQRILDAPNQKLAEIEFLTEEDDEMLSQFVDEMESL